METFFDQQRKADEDFQRRKEERWKKETEMEERRRQEDRVHEINMLQLILQALSGRSNP